MRKVEIIEEEILVTKQALVQYKDSLQGESSRVNILEIEVIDKILKKIKEEFNK